MKAINSQLEFNLQLHTAKRVVRRVAKDIAMALVQNPDIRIAEVMEAEKAIMDREAELRDLSNEQQRRTRNLIRLITG